VRGAGLARDARWNDALEAFQASYALRPHPITSYNLGYCERAIGHSTRAYKMLRRALAEHKAAKLGRLPDRLLELAQLYLPEVEHRIARVQVTAESADDRLLIDGRPLERSEASDDATPVLLAGTSDPSTAETLPATRFILLIDPGSHVIVLSRQGRSDSVRTEAFEPGASSSLELKVDPLPEATPAPLPSSTREPRSPASFPRGWAYASLGVGFAGITAGSIAGVAALRKRSSLVDACGVDHGDCPSRSNGDITALRRDADFASVAFAVGGLGIAAGTTALLLLRGDRRPPAIAPTIGLGSAGLVGRF
jgi:hypothetical protein